MALEVARLLEEAGDQVLLVLLFDAPVRTQLSEDTSGEGKGPREDQGDQGDHGDLDVEATVADLAGEGADPGVVAQAAQHFRTCTKLLAAHVTGAPRSQGDGSYRLQCSVFSFRPLDCSVEDDELRHLTTPGLWRTFFVPGTHWTMLFDPNVQLLARNVTEALSRDLDVSRPPSPSGISSPGFPSGISSLSLPSPTQSDGESAILGNVRIIPSYFGPVGNDVQANRASLRSRSEVGRSRTVADYLDLENTPSPADNISLHTPGAEQLDGRPGMWDERRQGIRAQSLDTATDMRRALRMGWALSVRPC